VLAAVLLPVFIWRSGHHPAPLLDLDLFRLRSFSAAVSAQSLFVGTCFGWLVLMPSFFQSVWGWSPLASGFALAPSPMISGLLSPFAGRVADRAGHRALIVTGTAAQVAGTLWWVFAIGPEPNYVRDVLPGMVLTGIGSTAGFATLTGAIMRDIPPRFYSMAGAARSTMFQLASAIGIAVAVALVGMPAVPSVAPFARTWWFGAFGAAAAGLVVLVAYPSRARRRATELVIAPSRAT
jgi:MFS family permease